MKTPANLEFTWEYFYSSRDTYRKLQALIPLHLSCRSFLSMRRYEKFYVQRAMKGIKLTKCAWLYPEGCRVTAEGHMAARRRMCSWIHFVFTHLVVPLVRASFYVTENEASKMRSDI